MPACCFVKPVTTSSSVVFPAPFGPMSPTTSPGVTVNETSSTATTPPNRTVMPCTSSSTPRARGAGSTSIGRSATSCSTGLKKRANRLATSEAVPSGARRSSWITPMPLKIASHAATLSRFGKISPTICSAIAPGAAAAPATTPEIQPRPPMTAYCTSRIEPNTLKFGELHAPFAEPEQDAAERGDAGADRERVDLDPDHADPERGRGPLVAPHRDHLAAGRADPQVGDDERHQHQCDQHDAGVALRVQAGADVPPEDLGVRDPDPLEASGQARVLEDQRAEHEREGEGDDRERDAAGPDRRERDEHTHPDGRDDADHQRDREADAEVVRRPRRGPGTEPGERVLAQRELPGVAGDDDHRRHDDGHAERRDEGVGVALGGGDEHRTHHHARRRAPPG